MKFFNLKGVIFDVDDTLLDNFPDGVSANLHDLSQLEAAHIVGKRYGVKGLQMLTIEQSQAAFSTAKEHSIRGAMWQILRTAGAVQGDEIDLDNPLLQELMTQKEVVHEQRLRTEGREIPGAVSFVRTLAQHGLREHLAIATTASRRDVIIFLEMTGLDQIFSAARVITRQEITEYKPHPEAFDKAFISLGLPEADRQYVIAFEDDPRGIASARAAGLFVCGITGKRFTKQALMALPVPPDMVADSYAEFSLLLAMPQQDGILKQMSNPQSYQPLYI